MLGENQVVRGPTNIILGKAKVNSYSSQENIAALVGFEWPISNELQLLRWQREGGSRGGNAGLARKSGSAVCGGPMRNVEAHFTKGRGNIFSHSFTCLSDC